jgi:NAD(P)H dehydrogenase (quinone)
VTPPQGAEALALERPSRIAVIYYSATGNVHGMARAVADGASRVWQQGELVDKVATAFTSSQTEHGGQESTILALNHTLYHWGAIVLPLGYTVHEVFNGGGNPYGSSFTRGHSVRGPDEEALLAARTQGERLARVARVIGAARESGLLSPKPSPTISGRRLQPD